MIRIQTTLGPGTRGWRVLRPSNPFLPSGSKRKNTNMHVRACTSVCVCYECVCMCACVHVCVCTCACACTFMLLCVHVWMCECVCVCLSERERKGGGILDKVAINWSMKSDRLRSKPFILTNTGGPLQWNLQVL